MCIYSGFICIILITSKNEIVTIFVRYHEQLKNRFQNDPGCILCSNNAEEFILGDLKLYYQRTGIDIDSGAPFSPELNGLTEKKMPCAGRPSVEDSSFPCVTM